MVRCSVELNTGFEKALQGIAKRCAIRVEKREVIQSSGAGSSWLSITALPGVQPDMVVIAPSGEEGSGVADSLCDFKAKNVLVEIEGALKVSYLQVNMSYLYVGLDLVMVHKQLDESVARRNRGLGS